MPATTDKSYAPPFHYGLMDRGYLIATVLLAVIKMPPVAAIMLFVASIVVGEWYAHLYTKYWLSTPFARGLFHTIVAVASVTALVLQFTVAVVPPAR